MRLCNHNYVIHRTNRARYALNKEILDLLNEESVECAGGRAGLKFNEKSTASPTKNIIKDLKSSVQIVRKY